MRALGAIHISVLTDTRDTHIHRVAAMGYYGKAVSQLQALSSTQGAIMERLATNLLLCMFAMISANYSSWRTHLLGAGLNLQAIVRPLTSGPRNHNTYGLDGSDAVSSRRFLVSMMSYLDVAASCARGKRPLIDGDYWERWAGGWEYNLGVPSFATASESTDRIMAQLRSSQSKVMSILTKISYFATLVRSGLDDHRRQPHTGTLRMILQIGIKSHLLSASVWKS
ncbi:hypothetical protein CDD83_6337 [Cordyceps sp. RAO-2017]|nr:hypothetical protein CDD83_6337 [Cordyceps sp. RAO-2017]